MSRTICVFLHYQGPWSTETKEEIFKDGEITWAGYKLIQLGHDDGVEWDEIVIVKYSNEQAYNDVLGYLAADNKTDPYQVILIDPAPPEELEMRNAMFRKARDDPTTKIDFTPSEDEDKVYPTANRERWKILFNGDYQEDIVMLNCVKFNDTPKYPDDYKGKKKKTVEAAYAGYQIKAFPTLGKVGAQIDAVGKLLATIVSVRDINYDFIAFAHYPSVPAFRKVFTATTRIEGKVHQLAALDAENSDGYAIRPYKDFCF
jgi:hypothetical protein